MLKMVNSTLFYHNIYFLKNQLVPNSTPYTKINSREIKNVTVKRNNKMTRGKKVEKLGFKPK